MLDPLNMSFGDHLDDLRRRVFMALIVPVPLFILALIFGKPLLEMVLAPLIDSLKRADQPPQLIATSPIETFAAYMKVALIVALVISLPWVLYQLWLFIAPGLYRHERRFVYFFLPLSTALTAVGLLFLYYIMLPISLYFLISFGASVAQLETAVKPLPAEVAAELPQLPVLDFDPAGVEPGTMWINGHLGQLRVALPDGPMGVALQFPGLIAQQYRVGEYVGLVFMLALVFVLAFQLPVVMMLVGWSGIVEAQQLTKYRKQVLFACVVVGAVMTPQDPFTLLILGGALYLLFEFGLLLMARATPSRIAGPVGPGDSDEEQP